MPNPIIRSYEKADIKAISSIYSFYVEKTTATFDTIPPKENELSDKFESLLNANYPIFVLELNRKVIGYSYASAFRIRPAYYPTAEAGIYIDPDFHTKGYGKKLYKTLIEELKKREFHKIISVVPLPNEKSEKLHRSLGFTEGAFFREIGYKFDKWCDIRMWELPL